MRPDSSDRDRVYLADILESARLAISYVQGIEIADFRRDTQLQDAVIRRIEMIGEGARRISESGVQRWDDLPWREMVDIRNVMIHEYDAVDLDIVWDTVKSDLPRLVEDLERILG